MLILTRRPGEKIMIGDDVVVQVMKAENNSVSIGIQAPKDRPVHREEIFMRIQRQQDF